MKKQVLAVFAALVLLFAVVVPAAYAQSTYLIDEAGLLTESEQQELQVLLEEISTRQRFDVAIITVNGLDGYTAQEFSDNCYDDYGYGYGDNRDGILLLISMEDRDWAMTANGYGADLFPKWELDALAERFLPDLSDGFYAEAFTTFAYACDEAITIGDAEISYDPETDSYYDDSTNSGDSILGNVAISLVVGLVLALIIVAIMKSQLKSVRSQSAAGSYVRDGSMQITDSRELYLYRTVNRTAKPKNNSSGSSGRSGGSGRSGSSGKF